MSKPATAPQTAPVTITRLKMAAEKIGVCRAMLYRLAKEPGFPKIIAISQRARGIRTAELDEWIKSRAESSDRQAT